MKAFSMQHQIFDKLKPIVFTEDSAPLYLKKGGHPGSTMDIRWWWNNHVMPLEVGGWIDTDWQRITRLKDVEENLPA